MAGSIKWFRYTADSGSIFAVKLDESNTEAVNTTTGDYGATDTEINALPRNLKPRYCEYGNAARTIRRRVVALTPTVYSGVGAGATITDQVSGETLSLIRKVGEVLSIPFAFDTGLTDGDAT